MMFEECADLGLTTGTRVKLLLKDGQAAVGAFVDGPWKGTADINNRSQPEGHAGDYINFNNRIDNTGSTRRIALSEVDRIDIL